MDWGDVGKWIKGNAGTGASLVGSLLTGNVPGAVAAGVALVNSATGRSDPGDVLDALQTDPATLVRLKELAYENEASIRKHLEDMTRLQLEDVQREHHETQETIRSGDNAEDKLVRRTRPLQSWLSLLAAIIYVFTVKNVDVTVLGLLLALPWAYAGLRQVGKGIDSIGASVVQRAARKGGK
ncbi:MAG: hypothetical protein KDI14_02555 [Halioglobus sp.]|nr:hypothetical protein [Halioglobus sp.]